MAPCPVCHDPGRRTMLAQAGLIPGAASDLVQCSGCEVIRFDPLPTVDQLNSFYAKVKFGLRPRASTAGGEWFGRRLRHLAPAGRILDVGCGTGYFLEGFRRSTGWEVSGVELSRQAVEFARDRLGLAVHQGELREAGFPADHFDVVHLNNVLEHVPDPVGLLEECRRVLKPQGLFHLAVPNGLNDVRNLIDFHRTEGRPGRSPSGHIYFFPARTLEDLFGRLGFSVHSRRTGSIKPGLRNAGILARRRNWKDEYRFPPVGQPIPAQGVVLEKEKNWPSWYYRYRNWSAEYGRLPGLHDFGLDFLFELRRAAPEVSTRG